MADLHDFRLHRVRGGLRFERGGVLCEPFVWRGMNMTREAPRKIAPSRDKVVLELIAFFHDELLRNPSETVDWFAQGDYDVDAFITAVSDLKSTIEANL